MWVRESMDEQLARVYTIHINQGTRLEGLLELLRLLLQLRPLHRHHLEDFCSGQLQPPQTTFITQARRALESSWSSSPFSVARKFTSVHCAATSGL